MVIRNLLISVSVCVPDCKGVVYSTVITHGQLRMSNYSRTKYGIPSNRSTDSMTSLHFYFPTLTQTKIANKPDNLSKWLGKHLIRFISYFFFILFSLQGMLAVTWDSFWEPACSAFWSY